MKEEGCRRCGTLGLKLRRMLEEDGGCRSTNCHIREFIEFAAMLIRRHHRCDSSFFERIGATPKSIAFDCAGDILRDGQYPFDEVVCFFARRFQVIAGVPLVALVATYKIIVRSMILGTIIRMREIEDDWARKIRGGIEQALWKHPRFGSMEHGDKTFHYHRDRGEPRPMPEGPQEPEDLLPDIRRTLKERDERRKAPEEHRKGRRRRKRAESDPFHAILEAIFIVLAKRDGFNPALTVSTLTVIVLRWYESKLVAEYGEPAEDEPDPLDDSMILAIEATLKFLRRGRMDGLLRDGAYTKSECDSILGMVCNYLENVLRGRMSGRLDAARHWRDAFPERDPGTCTKRERKRIAEILRLARKHLDKLKGKNEGSSPSAEN